ncbi:PREDICTED: uncharacterized protein LOC108782609 [Cyphomyrmex costatus]|uniref:uncharacterized protein LOC108782609 n=1 Tax=Cyphomyrmex costatus TaxID=456900 RepID=UPI0008523EFB|nr:PREDICTED: uncharacterized protein LOC108782609 [Cyphomyrmex costatus]
MGIGAPSPVDTASTVVKHKIKLPVASLPNFDGRYENWLSFKNTFIAMIDTRTDLSDVEKLQYLQSVLTGEAANKIKILTIESANYSKAWELLKHAYEKRKLLRAYPSSPTTHNNMSGSLAAMGVSVGSEILVNILESKLPKNTADKWEETLGRDEFPKIDELYEFLHRTAVRVSERVRSEASRFDDKFILS